MAKYEQIKRISITFMVGVYNEEDRIRPVLEHAIRWADEIIIVNKSSTDKTKDICLEYGNRVKVIDIPFSPKGHEDVIALTKNASNDWIFFSTASEIPTFGLIKHVRQILDETNGQLDLVYVPRKIYSFGIHSSKSPWSISYYPFLINLNNSIVSNTIHDNFRPRSHKNTYKIPYVDDCCVYHFTHPTAKTYLTDMMQYFEAEVLGNMCHLSKYKECFANMDKYKKKYREIDDELFGLYCAWQMYWLGTALYTWEKQRGINVPEYYADFKNDIIQKEWHSHLPSSNILSHFGKSTSIKLLWDESKNVQTEDDLLLELSKRKICYDIRVLYVVGAHRFQENELFFMMFPMLEKVYLFEPLPIYFDYLSKTFKNDSRIKVFPYAIADEDISTQFYVTNNDAASSSLLPLGNHLELFPKVYSEKTILVSCRTLNSIIAENNLIMPDMLFIDAQGAEYKIISSISAQLRSKVKLIFTEASKEELYIGSRMLDDIKELLNPDYHFAGFASLNSNTPTHGNALFVNYTNINEYIDKSDRYVMIKSDNNQLKKGIFFNIFKKILNVIKDKIRK